MSKALVEVLHSKAIRIACPTLFREERNRSRFLTQAFGVPEVRSVEIDAPAGIGVVHLGAAARDADNVLRKLAAKLDEAPAAPPGDAAYFQFPRRDGRLAYARAPKEITGIRRPIYKALGSFFVGMSVIGVISPFVPTTPFVLLSGCFFIRSSAHSYERLATNRVFGPILHDFCIFGGLRRRYKSNVLLLMGVVLGSSAAISGFHPAAMATMGLVSLASVSLLLWLPTAPDRVTRTGAKVEASLRPALAAA
jgi:uncharacterized membrane protein YbaN (DUF454 family)